MKGQIGKDAENNTAPLILCVLHDTACTTELVAKQHDTAFIMLMKMEEGS